MPARPAFLCWTLAALASIAAAPAALAAAGRLDELVQKCWRQEDGLPHDSAYKVIQTRDGHLWVGTREGLARFDGVRFEVFGRAELRLERTSRIQALAEDPAGNLWIGTDGGELLRYRDGAFRNFGAADGLTISRITDLVIGKDGELLIATYGEGIHVLSAGSFRRLLPDDFSLISRLAVGSDGGLWIATIGGGLSRWHGGRLETFTEKDGLPSNQVWSVATAPDGGVWAGTQGGLAFLRDGRFATYTVADGLRKNHVTTLHVGADGVLWLGTYGGGVQRLHPGGRIESLPAGQPGGDDLVWSLYEDRSGTIWAANADQGLRLFAASPFSLWKPRRDGLRSRLVTALAEDAGGTIYVGSRDAGVAWRRGGRWSYLGAAEGLLADSVWSLEAGREGLLIGTSHGLFRLAGERAVAVPLPELGRPPDVFALLERDGELWIGTDRGLLHVAPEGRRLFTTADGLPANAVRYLVRDEGRGRLYAATAGGLAVLEAGQVVARHPELARAAALHLDQSGTLWAALSVGGLARLAAGRVETWGAAELGDDKLYGIAEDRKGQLWLAGARGLLRLPRASLETAGGAPPGVLHFDRFDGLEPGAIGSTGRRALLGTDGRLHFATLGGVAVYDPAAAKAASSPAALIHRVEVDGRPLAPQRPGAPLPVDGRHVTFRFAAPLPHAGPKIRMRYRLVGFDEDFVEAGGERSAAYAGLASGDYTFEVEASSSNGAYLTPPASFPLRVRAGFFDSWRLPLFAIAAISGLAFLLHRYRLARLAERERELARRIETAVADIEKLQELLPICGECLKVRDDRGYWQQVEGYLAQRQEVAFTHGLCPECAQGLMEEISREP
jgi:ligand-binding sensor domain-containing protein